jgi:ATPase subunit of ABC transporter with duplicated ATPase domains
MGLNVQQLAQPYQTLSVGERIRAAMAKLMLDEPTILLLDEPTNNLDRDGRMWLQELLTERKLGVLMVCHDRAMVDAVADRVLELTATGLSEYSGGYADMLREKQIASTNQMDLYERQRHEQKRLRTAFEGIQRTAKKVGSKPTGRTYDPKAKAFFRGKQARVEKRAAAVRSRSLQLADDHVEKPFREVLSSIEFKSRPLRHSEALVVRNLTKSFEGMPVIEGLNLTLGAGERIALVAPNGAGKTTLFRLLLGELLPDFGTIAWSSNAKPIFLSQERSMLNLDSILLDAFGDSDASVVRNLLACLRIVGDAVEKPIWALSVGERTKAELAAMLLTDANVLLMDEPTNHLDTVSLEAMEDAILAFPGSVLFTSHDHAFVDRVAHRTMGLR